MSQPLDLSPGLRVETSLFGLCTLCVETSLFHRERRGKRERPRERRDVTINEV